MDEESEAEDGPRADGEILLELRDRLFENFAEVPDDELEGHNYEGRCEGDLVEQWAPLFLVHFLNVRRQQ